jgi:DNA-3-methyladenine glycosylase II
MRPLTRDSLKEGAAALARKDPALGRWIRLIGPLDFRPRPGRFHSLCRAIISQQLSAAAARSIHGRFIRLFTPTRRPTPRRLLDIRPRRLKRCGLSEKKVLYLRELARAFEGGPLRRRRFASMENEKVIELLIPLPGIGRWTAEMFLIFCLGRPDIFSMGDLALRTGIQRVAGQELSDEKVIERSRGWSPWRTVACLYLWKISHWEGEPAE